MQTKWHLSQVDSPFRASYAWENMPKMEFRSNTSANKFRDYFRPVAQLVESEYENWNKIAYYGLEKGITKTNLSYQNFPPSVF